MLWPLLQIEDFDTDERRHVALSFVSRERSFCGMQDAKSYSERRRICIRGFHQESAACIGFQTSLPASEDI